MSVPSKFLLLAFVIACACAANAQDRGSLEKQRQKIEQQIRETNALLKQSQKEKQATVSNLETLKSEIAMREQVVGSMKKELDLLNNEVSENTTSLRRLESSMAELKKDHGIQMRNAYFEKQMSHPILFILSADNLNEAFLRWQYRNRIQHARKRTLEELQRVSGEISHELSTLENLKTQKTEITEDMEEQEAELKKSASAAQEIVSSLEKKERSLRTQLEKQQKESKQLSAEIERVIAAEINKSTNSGTMPATPAVKALSTEFAKNKGKLPWPVEQGVVTTKFGTQPHPVVKTITVSNNGVDITAPKGSTVKCIFGGKVVGRKFIPGHDHMVIIQHGAYYTVYSRLAEVNVEINQEVDARKVIGRLSDKGDENPRLHLEIWENKVQLDPEKWIAR